MAHGSNWVVSNMKRLAAREAKLQPKNKRPKLTEKAQVRRFLMREEMQRMKSGEITPTQFHRYERRMLKKYFGMEVD